MLVRFGVNLRVLHRVEIHRVQLQLMTAAVDEMLDQHRNLAAVFLLGKDARREFERQGSPVDRPLNVLFRERLNIGQRSGHLREEVRRKVRSERLTLIRIDPKMALFTIFINLT